MTSEGAGAASDEPVSELGLVIGTGAEGKSVAEGDGVDIHAGILLVGEAFEGSFGC